jgi:hypothetical protein
MPRLSVPAYADPSNTVDAKAQSVSRVINEYLQSAAPGHARAPVYPRRTPGVTPVATWPDGPIRGMFEINDRCFIVGGATFGELTSTYSIIHTGTVTNDEQPVAMASNGTAGHQVMITSGGDGYIFDLTSNTLSQITDADFLTPTRSCEFLGGYFLSLRGSGSRTFQWSALEDGTSWDSLDVAERSYASDNISSIIRSHTELWVIGFRTSEVWVMNSGGGNNAWVPQTGVFIEHGGQGIHAPCRIDNSIMWMGLNDDGQGVVFRADGYTPRRVSTSAVETWLQRANTPTDARAFVMQMDGHVFYHLILPRDVDTTFVYDVSMDRWHEWGIWDPRVGRYYPHIAGSHVFVFNTHLVGARLDVAGNNIIYRCSLDLYHDTIVGSLA